MWPRFETTGCAVTYIYARYYRYLSDQAPKGVAWSACPVSTCMLVTDAYLGTGRDHDEVWQGARPNLSIYFRYSLGYTDHSSIITFYRHLARLSHLV